MKRLGFLSLTGFLFLGCGSSATATLDIAIAQSGTQDPFHTISVAREAGLSRGVYFEFRELNCPPVSIEDTKDSTTVALSYPDLIGNPSIPGTDPLQSSFTVDTSSLKATTFYRLSMFALNVDGTKPFEGVGDCPLYLAQEGQNRVVICFGDAGINRQCAGTVSFGQCPAPADAVSKCPS